MLNREGNISYTCTNCDEYISEEVVVYIDAVKEPELRKKLLKYELFDFECPHCKNHHSMLYPFLYVDSKNKFSVFCNKLYEIVNFFDDEDYFDKNSYNKFKKVGSVYGLDAISKIIALENGYDYKIIEIFKYMLKKEYQKQYSKVDNIEIELIYDEQGKMTWMVYLTLDGKPKGEFIPFESNVYNDIYKKYYKRLDGTNDIYFSEEVIERVLIDDDAYRESFKKYSIKCFEVNTFFGDDDIVTAPLYNVNKYKEDSSIIIRTRDERFIPSTIIKQFKFNLYGAPFDFINCSEIYCEPKESILNESNDQIRPQNSQKLLDALINAECKYTVCNAKKFPYELVFKSKVFLIDPFVSNEELITPYHCSFINSDGRTEKYLVAFTDEKKLNDYINMLDDRYNPQNINNYLVNLDDLLLYILKSDIYNDGIILNELQEHLLITPSLIYKEYLLHRLYYMNNEIYEIIESLTDVEKKYIGQDNINKLLAIKNKDELFTLLYECNNESRLEDEFKISIQKLIKMIKYNYTNYK